MSLARGLFRVTLAICWVVASAKTAEAIVLSLGRAGFGSVAGIAGAIAFAGLSSLLLLRRVHMPERGRIIRAGWRVVITGFAVFVCLTVLLGGHRQPFDIVTLLAVFGGALAEETVFRRLLTEALGQELHRLMRSTRAHVASVAVAAATFAGVHDHALAMDDMARSLPEFGRLFAAGVLYTVLVARAGLALAAGVHAALNYDLLVLQWNTLLLPLWTKAVLVVAAVGIGLLWHARVGAGLSNTRPSWGRS